MKTVLVIDDDELMRIQLEYLLVQAGFEVRILTDGVAAIELLKSISIDLVITDIFMPELDGIETISMIKAKYPELPIIAISGKNLLGESSQDVLQLAMQKGASCTFTKPFSQDEIIKAVTSLLQ